MKGNLSKVITNTTWSTTTKTIINDHRPYKQRIGFGEKCLSQGCTNIASPQRENYTTILYLRIGAKLTSDVSSNLQRRTTICSQHGLSIELYFNLDTTIVGKQYQLFSSLQYGYITTATRRNYFSSWKSSPRINRTNKDSQNGLSNGFIFQDKYINTDRQKKLFHKADTPQWQLEYTKCIQSNLDINNQLHTNVRDFKFGSQKDWQKCVSVAT